MKFLRTIRIFFFGPSKNDLEQEFAPATPLLNEEQRNQLRREVCRVNWIDKD